MIKISYSGLRLPQSFAADKEGFDARSLPEMTGSPRKTALRQRLRGGFPGIYFY